MNWPEAVVISVVAITAIAVFALMIWTDYKDK